MIAESWPILVAALVATTLTHLFMRSSPDVPRLKRQLSGSLARFRDVADDRLDPALLEAGQSLRRGWLCVATIVVDAIPLWAAFLSVELVPKLFPDLPGWSGIVVAVGVGLILVWPGNLLEKRLLLLKIEKHLQGT